MPTHIFTRRSRADDGQTHSALLQVLPTIQDVSVTAAGRPIEVSRKRNVLKNRWGMTATIEVESRVITVTVDGQGSMHASFADEIFGGLPQDMLDDQGLSQAVERMSRSERFFSGAELRRIQDDLRPDEQVRLMASGAVGSDLALIVVTTRRILLKDKKFTSSASREIYPRQITSITTGSARGNEILELTVSGGQIRIGQLQAGRADALAREIRSLAEAASNPVVNSPAPASAADELTKLAKLHSDGILSDDEFAAAKARLLGI